MGVTRGEAISAYLPPFSEGAKVYSTNVKMQVITSAVANSGVVYSLTHSLGAVPTVKIFTSRGTVSQLKGATASANSIGEATVSAATTTKVYFAGAKNTAFTVYLMV